MTTQPLPMMHSLRREILSNIKCNILPGSIKKITTSTLQSTPTDDQCLLAFAEELCNVATDLYAIKNYSSAMKLYKSASSAIIVMTRASQEIKIFFDKFRNEFLSQIVQGKEEIHQTNPLMHRPQETGMNSYQWSETDSEVMPQYLSQAIKIDIQGRCNIIDGSSNVIALATILYNMGLVYIKTGHTNEAMKKFSTAIELRSSQVLSSSDLVFSASLNNIGCIRFRNGNIQETSRLFQFAGRLAKDSLQKHDLNRNFEHLGTILYNIGIIDSKLGSFETATEVFQLSLYLQKRALGEHHPDIVSLYHNVGVIYLTVGRLNQAMSSFFDALQHARLILGNEHQIASRELFYIAKVYELKCQHDEALHAYTETLRIERLALGAQHLDTVVTLCEIARIYENKGNINQGLRYYDEALSIVNRSKHKNQSLIVSILCQKINVCIENSDISFARKMYGEVLEIIGAEKGDFKELIGSVEFARLRSLLANPPAAAAA